MHKSAREWAAIDRDGLVSADFRAALEDIAELHKLFDDLNGALVGYLRADTGLRQKLLSVQGDLRDAMYCVQHARGAGE